MTNEEIPVTNRIQKTDIKLPSPSEGWRIECHCEPSPGNPSGICECFTAFDFLPAGKRPRVDVD